MLTVTLALSMYGKVEHITVSGRKSKHETIIMAWKGLAWQQMMQQ